MYRVSPYLKCKAASPVRNVLIKEIGIRAAHNVCSMVTGAWPKCCQTSVLLFSEGNTQ